MHEACGGVTEGEKAIMDKLRAALETEDVAVEDQSGLAPISLPLPPM